MATTKEEHLAFIRNKYIAAWNHKLSAATYRSTAYSQWAMNADHASLGSLISSVLEIVLSLEDVIWKWHPYPTAGAVPHFLQYFTIDEAPPYELTLRAILDEMFTADNEELLQFIALVDAYRQSLWDKPFNAEYWSAVARGFEQWG